MLAIVITLRYELYWQMDACGGSTSMMQHWNVPLLNFLPIDPKLENVASVLSGAYEPPRQEGAFN